MTREENEKRLAYLKSIVQRLPDKPGSYQFYDHEHTIIYVGKAKNLKNRVSSYFHKEVDRFKTKVLVSKVWDISYTVVNTEEDALLLENSLIKKYNPRYNVLLKDGKTYPSICVTKEFLPRIFKTRTINKKYGTYFGPYSQISTMYGVLDIIHKIYKPRTCHFPITKEGIEQGKYLPGVSHTQLQSSLHRKAILRGVSASHCAGSRNPERKHPRSAAHALRRDAENGRRIALRRG